MFVGTVCQTVKKLSNESLIVFDLSILPEVSVHGTVDGTVEYIGRLRRRRWAVQVVISFFRYVEVAISPVAVMFTRRSKKGIEFVGFVASHWFTRRSRKGIEFVGFVASHSSRFPSGPKSSMVALTASMLL